MKPQRIVSLCPSNTEILFALGLGDRVVGADDHSDYPPQIEKLPKVGPDLKIKIERVKALEPDLVVASLTVPGMERNIENLQKSNLPYIVLNPKSIGEALDNMLMLGEVTGAEKEAEELVAGLKSRIEFIKAQAEKAERKPKLYWEWWPKPLISAGRPSWVNEMSEIVGGVNIFSQVDKTSFVVDEAEIIEGDPEVLLICWCGNHMQRKMRREKILERESWKDISGVKTGRIHCIPESLFGRPGPRLVDGLEMLAQIVHPEIFSTI